MSIKNTFKVILLVVATVLYVQHSFAQDYDNKDTKDGWHILVEPYFMLPYINGKVGIQPLPEAKISQRAIDILKNLKMQALISGEVYNKDWSFSTDIMYMRLGKAVDPESGIVKGDASLKQFNWEIAGMYRFLPWLEGGLALQLNHLKTTLDLDVNTPLGVVPMSKEGSRTWVDPSLVGRAYYVFTASKKWFVQCRANIGGFGIGSKFYWQAQPYIGYYFSKLFQMSAGYRIIGINYRQGASNEEFLYNMITHGPVIRLGFNLK